MSLEEMSEEYRLTALVFRARTAELAQVCAEGGLSSTERIVLCRRLCVLKTMERDLMATSKYLKNYYGRNEND